MTGPCIFLLLFRSLGLHEFILLPTKLRNQQGLARANSQLCCWESSKVATILVVTVVTGREVHLLWFIENCWCRKLHNSFSAGSTEWVRISSLCQFLPLQVMPHCLRPPAYGRPYHDIFADAGCLQLLFVWLNADSEKSEKIFRQREKKIYIKNINMKPVLD